MWYTITGYMLWLYLLTYVVYKPRPGTLVQNSQIVDQNGAISGQQYRQMSTNVILKQSNINLVFIIIPINILSG
jgi:hypothetical protein